MGLQGESVISYSGVRALVRLLISILNLHMHACNLHVYTHTQRLCRDGPDHEAYYHELFLRGKPELVAAMTRLVSPGKRSPK